MKGKKGIPGFDLFHKILPKSELFSIKVSPSFETHASTSIKSVTKDGIKHFNIPALPRRTNSSETRD